MAGRSIRAIVATFVVAVMVGVREATGIEPPPPTLSTEEIEWLSPGLENDDGAPVVFKDSTAEEVHPDPDSEPQPRHRLVGLARALLKRMAARRG